MIKREKSFLTGRADLVPRDEWIEFDDMNGEEQVLNHPIFDVAFSRLVDKHTPTTNVCFLSLCTKVRPYTKSRKWRLFMKAFRGFVDFTVCSNGGVIPQDFWLSYPYLNYEAPREESGEFDDMYCRIFRERLMAFFACNKYDYVIANFRTNQRNYQPALETLTHLKELGKIKDFIIGPDEEMYDFIKKDPNTAKLGLMMFPDAHPKVIELFTEQLKKWGIEKKKIPFKMNRG